MKITDAEKSEIRRYYAGQYTLRFKEDGTVEAKSRGSSSWGILYTPWYTENHLKHIRDAKKKKIAEGRR
jgi:hypothetical protein